MCTGAWDCSSPKGIPPPDALSSDSLSLLNKDLGTSKVKQNPLVSEHSLRPVTLKEIRTALLPELSVALGREGEGKERERKGKGNGKGKVKGKRKLKCEMETERSI